MKTNNVKLQLICLEKDKKKKKRFKLLKPNQTRPCMEYFLRGVQLAADDPKYKVTADLVRNEDRKFKKSRYIGAVLKNGPKLNMQRQVPNKKKNHVLWVLHRTGMGHISKSMSSLEARTCLYGCRFHYLILSKRDLYMRPNPCHQIWRQTSDVSGWLVQKYPPKRDHQTETLWNILTPQMV